MFSWLTGSKSVPTFIPSATDEYVWFAYIMLDIEENQEHVVTFWKALVEELKEDSTGLDAAMKLAAEKLGVAVPNSNFLAIYRWHNQLLTTPVGHPLMPLIVQKYFHYFLARPLPDNL